MLDKQVFLENTIREEMAVFNRTRGRHKELTVRFDKPIHHYFNKDTRKYGVIVELGKVPLEGGDSLQSRAMLVYVPEGGVYPIEHWGIENIAFSIPLVAGRIVRTLLEHKPRSTDASIDISEDVTGHKLRFRLIIW